MSRMDASQGQREYRAANPPYGAMISFNAPEATDDTAAVVITDSRGNQVREMKVTDVGKGVNRFAWDLRHDGPVSLTRPVATGWWGGDTGPRVSPGTYTVTLTLSAMTAETEVVVKGDPRIPLAQRDFERQEDAAIELRDLLSKVHTVLNGTDAMTGQLKELKGKLKSGNNGDIDESEAKEKIKAAVKLITQFRNDELKRPVDGLSYRQRPRLREEIRSLTRAIDGTTARPTDPQMLRLSELRDETDAVVNRYNSIISNEVAEINDMFRNFPQVSIKKATYGRD